MAELVTPRIRRSSSRAWIADILTIIVAIAVTVILVNTFYPSEPPYWVRPTFFFMFGMSCHAILRLLAGILLLVAQRPPI